MKRAIVASVLMGALVLTGTGATAGVSWEKVVGGPGQQYWPSSSGDHVAFTEYRRRGYNAVVSPLALPGRIRVNAPGWSGVLGTLMAGTDVVLYQQYRPSGSDLFLYDVSSRRRTRVPKPVKSDRWEYWPVGSQAFILFGRYFGGRNEHRELLLYDRTSHTVQVLIGDMRRLTIFPGFAGERYVAWTTCNRPTCWISYYDTDTDTLTKVANPAGKARYAPAIDEATNTIYFIESPAGRCGVNVTLRRATLGDPTTTVMATLPKHIDTGWTLSPAPNAVTGELDLFFERWDCRRTAADVFVFRSVDQPVTPVLGLGGGDDLGPFHGARGEGRSHSMPGAPPARGKHI